MEPSKQDEIAKKVKWLLRKFNRRPRHTIGRLELLLDQDNKRTKRLDFDYNIQFYQYAFLLLNLAMLSPGRNPLRHHSNLIKRIVPEGILREIKRQFGFNKIFKRHIYMSENFNQPNPYE